jgi:hypothetical protein
MVGKSKNRRRTAEFSNFQQHLHLLINVNRNAALQRKGMEIFQDFANSRWAILPPLLLADSRCLSISQWLSNTLSELPRGCPIAFDHFPSGFIIPF